MEAVSSKDGTPFLDLNATRNRAELACIFTSLPIGISIWHGLNFDLINCTHKTHQIAATSERRVADTLDRTRTRILAERSSEKANKIGGTNTRAILFFVTTSISNEKDKIKSVLLKMLGEMPGKLSRMLRKKKTEKKLK